MPPTVPTGAAGEKFLKFNTFSCIFKTKNDKFYVFSLKVKNLTFVIKKNGACGADRRSRRKFFEPNPPMLRPALKR